jgi:pimeloyl-ACP methyl ester carboxylesterase
MSAWQSGELTANGLRIHYTRTGGDKPPMVLSHGVTDDGLCWTPIAQALESDYEIVMVDARGHGRSEAPLQGYAPLEQAADLAGVISGLGLRKPILLGHSMGAVTTLVLAGIYPDMPGSILLEDPPNWWMPAKQVSSEDEDSERQAMMVKWITGLQGKTRQQLIDEQRLAAPRWSEAELGPWADSKLRFNPQVFSIFGPNPAVGVDWKLVLSQITCPALLITADPALGSIVTEESAMALQTLLPQLKIAHIPGAGHNIRREQFEQYLSVIRSFLNDVVK